MSRPEPSGDVPLPPAPVGLPECFCPECDYNLRALTSDRCPECGWKIDRERLETCQIPWVQRRRLGRFRAFWGTVHLVSLHPKRFSRYLALPGHSSDLDSFRGMLFIHVALTVFVAATGSMVGMSAGAGFLHSPGLLAGLVASAMLALGVGAAVLLGSAWPPWFCTRHAAHRSEQAGPQLLCGYLGAPLVLMVAPVLLLAGAFCCGGAKWAVGNSVRPLLGALADGLALGALGLASALCVFWAILAGGVVARVNGRGPVAAVGNALGLLVLWAITAAWAVGLAMLFSVVWTMRLLA